MAASRWWLSRVAQPLNALNNGSAGFQVCMYVFDSYFELSLASTCRIHEFVIRRELCALLLTGNL